MEQLQLMLASSSKSRRIITTDQPRNFNKQSITLSLANTPISVGATVDVKDNFVNSIVDMRRMFLSSSSIDVAIFDKDNNSKLVLANA
jgi:hypothetical protein